jgi:hypothetical protein
MRIKLRKDNLDLVGATGHDLVFSYLPRVVDGHFIWLEKVWRRYTYRRYYDIFGVKAFKDTDGYMLYDGDKK